MEKGNIVPIISGGGAGPWFGPGYVYVMKDRTKDMFKIGYTNDPQRRLKEIKNDFKQNEIELLVSFQALERNRAETAAQTAVKDQLGLKKDSDRGNATDWFVNPLKKSDQEICSVVKKAVAEHNVEEKKKQQQQQKQ